MSYDSSSTGYVDCPEYDYCTYSSIYVASTRINNNKPSLSCAGTKLTKYSDGTNIYAATLTADEATFAGATNSTNYNYYLMNAYAKDNNLDWWLLSPNHSYIYHHYGRAYAFLLESYLASSHVDSSAYSRPVVSLTTNTIITGGTGTIENPYVIK